MKKTLYSVTIMVVLLFTTILKSGAQIIDDLNGKITYVVAADGSGDYTNVQEAINAVPNNSSERTVIFIKNGTYKEKLTVETSKRNLVLIGENVDSTILSYDDYSGRVVNGTTLGTSTSHTMEVSADNFWAMNLTIENSYEEGSQAVALNTKGDKIVLLHCKLIGYQDTWYTQGYGRTYAKDCYIEGAVDYIFGRSIVMLDSCQIHTIRTGGYITAASTEEGYNFGYVFNECRLTSPLGVSGVLLGRPWRPNARTVFMKCYENAIGAAGWRTWDGRENTCFYAEYKCYGPDCDTTNRIWFGQQLSDSEAATYTMENIFSKNNNTSLYSSGWLPSVENDSLYEVIKKHSVIFLDPINFNANIKTLKYDGEEIPGFDPEIYNYSIDLTSGNTAVPELTTETESSDATVTIKDADEIPGFSTLLVVAKDGGTQNTYNIFWSVDGAYSNAKLDSIEIKGEKFAEFDPEVFEYNIALPEGTSKYFSFNGYAQVEDAGVERERVDELPGDAYITVTAVDGKTTQLYTFHFSIASDISDVNAKNRIKIVQQKNGVVLLHVSLVKKSDVELNIFDSTGRSVFFNKYKNLQLGRNKIPLQLNSSSSTILFYNLKTNRNVYHGEFLKK